MVRQVNVGLALVRICRERKVVLSRQALRQSVYVQESSVGLALTDASYQRREGDGLGELAHDFRCAVASVAQQPDAPVVEAVPHDLGESDVLDISACETIVSGPLRNWNVRPMTELES